MIPYCETQLKNSICHSLLTSGVRELGDENPKCSGFSCSRYFCCLSDNAEALEKIIGYEEQYTTPDEVEKND